MKKWDTLWVDGEASLGDALNKLEAKEATIFSIIYVRYSATGKTGYRVIYYTEVKRGK